MIVEKTSWEAVESAARWTGIRAVYVRQLPVTLGLSIELKQEPGERYSTGGGGVCLHGHAAFIKSLLEAERDAIVRTRAGLYRGWDGFCRDHARISTRAVRQFGRGQKCSCS